jgi:site-specific DNA-methyltransferase (adenine-specific)
LEIGNKSELETMDSDTTETRSNINLHLGDSLEAMRSMPDNAYDLAIVDPPYGINVNQMNMGSRKTIKPNDKGWDSEVPTQEYFYELFRVSERQIIWGGNYFNLPPSQYFAIWDKGETMYGRDFAECEFAWISKGGTRIFKTSPNQLDRIHVTQKPVKLYEWLLTNYAKEGDKILDTHFGSGSHGIACGNLGFDLDAYELDEDYFNASVNRINEHFKQLNAFQTRPNIVTHV